MAAARVAVRSGHDSYAAAHIVIAGGGVAAIEAVAALRALAGPLPRITAAGSRASS